MAGFFKKLFSKEDDTPYVMDYNDISGFLDESEKEIAEILLKSSKRSEEVVLDAVSELRKKADSLMSVKISDNAELPPRVKVVVEKSVPGFSASLKKALPDTLPEDPEEYYNSVALLVQAIAKCMSGQGKYIHTAFPEEIKDIKSSVAVIGREINAMNEEIKPAVERREKVSGVRQTFDKTEFLFSEKTSSFDEITKLKTSISLNESELRDNADSIAKCRKTPEFLEYEGYLNRISSLDEERRELKDSYHLSVATVSNVFRKIIYAAEKKGNTDFSKALFSFDDLLLSKGKKDAKVISESYSALYPEIKRYLTDNSGFLKNKSEERLLSDSDELTSRISGLCGKYNSILDEISDLKSLVASNNQAETLAGIESRTDAMNAECTHMKSRISILEERQKEISEELPKSCEKLVSVLSDLRGRDTVIENMPVPE